MSLSVKRWSARSEFSTPSIQKLCLFELFLSVLKPHQFLLFFKLRCERLSDDNESIFWLDSTIWNLKKYYWIQLKLKDSFLELTIDTLCITCREWCWDVCISYISCSYVKIFTLVSHLMIVHCCLIWKLPSSPTHHSPSPSLRHFHIFYIWSQLCF